MKPQADHGEASYVGVGRLEGRRALITGADSGIGRAVSLAFANVGGHLKCTREGRNRGLQNTPLLGREKSSI
jgi:NAD(P)-dependent dehydrogenase (short-subunit alcohol dehydrogenase family)